MRRFLKSKVGKAFGRNKKSSSLDNASKGAKFNREKVSSIAKTSWNVVN